MFNLPQLKTQDYLTVLVLFLALLIALSIGFGLGKKTQPQQPNVGQATEFSLAQGKIQSVASEELILETSGRTQKFKLDSQTQITLLTLPRFDLPPAFTTEGAPTATIPPPPPQAAPSQPQKIKASDLKVGEEASLVYKNVGGNLVAQSVSVARESK